MRPYVAALVGGAPGREREKRGGSARLRTNMLVILAVAVLLATLLGVIIIALLKTLEPAVFRTRNDADADTSGDETG